MTEPCANPLFLQWVKEIWDETRERNEKKGLVYKKAYESLKACPLRFEHPSEARQLHGIGPTICAVLTERLEKHCSENGIPMPKLPQKGSKRKSDDEGRSAPLAAKKPRKQKIYVPSLRSGPYALILALGTLSENGTQGLTKDETIRLAQPHCDSSFTVPSDPTKFYTAWNSMKTLIQKDLVYEHGRPMRRYMLTEAGWDVANNMKEVSRVTSGPLDNYVPLKSNSKSLSARARDSTPLRDPLLTEQNTADMGRKMAADSFFDFTFLMPSPDRGHHHGDAVVARQDASEYRQTDVPDLEANLIPNFTPIVVPAGSFSIHLVLDNREVRTKDDRDYISTELSKRGVTPLTRSLELGDALWIAKCKDSFELQRCGEEGDEIVLDHIVERKRLDDLVGSIKDGRFHEQKFRLRKSGIQNVTYIVEEITMSAEATLKYADAVASAIASTQVVNGYFIKKTQKLDDTIRYLARMTEMLKERYEIKPLHVIPSRTLTAKNHLPMLSHLRESEPGKTYHLTFPTFSSLCSKSDVLSLRDVFLKMLMCTRGVTGEKAIEIQRRWKTPRALIEAFESVTVDPKAKEALISDKLSELVGRKKIGRALSGKIAEVWG